MKYLKYLKYLKLISHYILCIEDKFYVVPFGFLFDY